MNILEHIFYWTYLHIVAEFYSVELLDHEMHVTFIIIVIVKYFSKCRLPLQYNAVLCLCILVYNLHLHIHISIFILAVTWVRSSISLWFLFFFTHENVWPLFIYLLVILLWNILKILSISIWVVCVLELISMSLLPILNASSMSDVLYSERKGLYISGQSKFIHTVLDYLYMHRQCERAIENKTYAWAMTVNVLFSSHVHQHNSLQDTGGNITASYCLLISFQSLWCVLPLLHTHTNTHSVHANSTSVTLGISYSHSYLHAMYVHAYEFRYQWVPEKTSYTLELELRGSCKFPTSWALNMGMETELRSARAKFKSSKFKSC